MGVLVLGQTPSWMSSFTAWPALALAWWLTFFSPLDLWHGGVMRQNVLLFAIGFGRAVSAAHAVTSWGADKVRAALSYPILSTACASRGAHPHAFDQSLAPTLWIMQHSLIWTYWTIRSHRIHTAVTRYLPCVKRLLRSNTYSFSGSQALTAHYEKATSSPLCTILCGTIAGCGGGILTDLLRYV